MPNTDVEPAENLENLFSGVAYPAYTSLYICTRICTQHNTTHTRTMHRSAGGWSQTWALQMGGPARGALGSREENARPCRDPPGARRKREEERENQRQARRKVAACSGETGGRKEGPMEEGSGRWGPEGAGEEEKEDPEVKEALSR